jgi:hypothetical protein
MSSNQVSCLFVNEAFLRHIMAMADSTDDDVGMRCVPKGTAKGNPVPGGAEDQANFIRAVSIGLSDLEAGREISFDDAGIRLGLDRNPSPS